MKNTLLRANRAIFFQIFGEFLFYLERLSEGIIPQSSSRVNRLWIFLMSLTLQAFPALLNRFKTYLRFLL